jgi:hypothetical protein
MGCGGSSSEAVAPAEKEGRMKGPLLKEVGQSFQLMGLMAAMVLFYVVVGLLAVRVLG